jgi:hypothetical protein
VKPCYENANVVDVPVRIHSAIQVIGIDHSQNLESDNAADLHMIVLCIQ